MTPVRETPVSVRHPTVEYWRRGRLFGVPIVWGYVDGARRTARFLHETTGLFGCQWDAGQGTQFQWRVGTPAPDAWDEITFPAASASPDPARPRSAEPPAK